MVGKLNILLRCRFQSLDRVDVAISIRYCIQYRVMMKAFLNCSGGPSVKIFIIIKLPTTHLLIAIPSPYLYVCVQTR